MFLWFVYGRLCLLVVIAFKWMAVMDLASLANNTEDPLVDTLIRGGIGVIETAFPGRVRGHYLIGSYQNGNPVSGSDIDVVLVLDDEFDADEKERFQALRIYCSMMSPIRLDFRAYRLDEQEEHAYVLKYHSLLLYGDDVRAAIPDPSPPGVTNMMLDYVGSLKVMRAFYEWPETLSYPLTYPDKDGEFYGYDLMGIQINAYPEDDTIPGTRALNCHLLFGARVLVRMQIACHFATRREMIERYAEIIEDDWAPILDEALTRCRSEWHYQIPQASKDRMYLRELCRRTLSFENRVVAECHAYLTKDPSIENLDPLFDLKRKNGNES
jgi:hypothetical protein